jgi:hypothetical protein
VTVSVFKEVPVVTQIEKLHESKAKHYTEVLDRLDTSLKETSLKVEAGKERLSKAEKQVREHRVIVDESPAARARRVRINL